jgi:hypothetical protein
MQFHNHRNLEGLHASFSPSQPHWLRYDDEKIADYFTNKRAAERGTRIHEWAKTTIDLGIKQPMSQKSPNAYLYAYINDAQGFMMDTEVVLYYSDKIFGTADAISFRKGPNGRYILRIHDLKTGVTKPHMEQLEVYAALFCLEYGYKPKDIDIELRIYQAGNAPVIHRPTPEVIEEIMNIIIHTDKVATEVDKEV